MRVVQLGPLPPPHGGVSTNLLAIHSLLISRGHDARIISVTSSSETENVPNAYKPRTALQLLRRLLTLDFDIVHFHVGGDFSLRLAVLTLVCGILPGKKSVVTFHSGGYALEAVKFAKPMSIRGIAFRSVDFLIGVNSQMLEMFRAYGVSEKKMRLILPFALNPPDPNTEIPLDLMDFVNVGDPFLLSVGGLEPEYSHSFMIDAMEIVLRKLPNTGLMIVGSGSLEAKLREQIASKNYSDRILLVDGIDHDILLRLIEDADILLRLTKYDGDAISVREALFLNTPVIATDNGMRPDGVNLVSSEPTAEEVVNKIDEVLTSELLTESDQNVDGQRNIDEVLKVYKELIAK
ncbi:MAG: glycosyltransferase family 4 protein [Pyrinomonadaceae bacterium]